MVLKWFCSSSDACILLRGPKTITAAGEDDNDK